MVSESKKIKDTKEALVEDENLEKTIVESYPNDVGLWPREKQNRSASTVSAMEVAMSTPDL